MGELTEQEWLDEQTWLNDRADAFVDNWNANPNDDLQPRLSRWWQSIRPVSPEFLPGHPLRPNPPSFYNRFWCRILTHHWILLEFRHQTSTLYLLCLRCSRYSVIGFERATLEGRQPPRVIQQND